MDFWTRVTLPFAPINLLYLICGTNAQVLGFSWVLWLAALFLAVPTVVYLIANRMPSIKPVTFGQSIRLAATLEALLVLVSLGVLALVGVIVSTFGVRVTLEQGPAAIYTISKFALVLAGALYLTRRAFHIPNGGALILVLAAFGTLLAGSWVFGSVYGRLPELAQRISSFTGVPLRPPERGENLCWPF